jgi:phosphate starvation-inducible protein PhoH and related proteins
MTESLVVELDDPRCADTLYGPARENVRVLERKLALRLHASARQITLESDDVDKLRFAAHLVEQLYELVQRGYALQAGDIARAIAVLRNTPNVRLRDIFLDTVLSTDRGRPIGPKGAAQKEYVEAIREHDLVFGVGPAGTGKTDLAMAMALDAFLTKRVKRIILTRPAVEAGERLGFLPGDLAEKVNPYLRPLKDALHDMMDAERAAHLLQTGRIEVAPLAFMRGRTLNDSFVILDEAQNATREQMKMFLTRLGFHTKTVVTGDVTQVDLPDGRHSGLVQAVELLRNIEGIRFCYFSEIDVVRHPLVMEIIRAYDRADQSRE